MDNFKIIQDNALIICPNSIKTQIVAYFNQHLPFNAYKIISKQELLKELTFSYEIDAVIYLNRQYGYSFELADEILKNLNLIVPGTQKLNQLYSIYNDLLEHHLLKFNPLFISYLQNKKIYICGYSKKDEELVKLLTKANVTYTYIEKTITTKDITVYEFDDDILELRYIFSSIASLCEQGISLNHIYIYNLPSEYQLIFKKYLYYHQIKFTEFNYINVYDSEIYQTFLHLLKSNSLIDSYNQLIEQITYDPFGIIDAIVGLVVEISNQKLTKEEEIAVLNFLAKKKKVKGYMYESMLQSCDVNTILTENDYVFMLGFSQNSYPVIYKDTDIYTDDEKKLMHKNTSSIKNDIAKEELINFIYSTPNLIITYKKMVGKTLYYPSILIDELKFKITKAPTSNFRYSSILTELEVATYYDQQILYGINNPHLSTFSKEDINYQSYNHCYKPFKLETLNQNLSLSYTQIDEYNNCPFKYYLKRILKVNTYDETFNLNLGNLFHQILQDSISKPIDLNNYQASIDNYFKTASSKFFLNKLLNQLMTVIKKNEDFKNITFYQDILTEEECTFNLDEQTTFTGKMDKIMIDKVDQSLIIIDYKTGNLHIDERKFQYGLNLQLPIYILLAKKQYLDYTCSGIFIQKIITKEPVNIEQNYLLEGMCINDQNKIKRLEPSLGQDALKSYYIKGLALNKDGVTIKNGKTLQSVEHLNTLADIALEQINRTKEEIRKGIFNISPISFNPYDNACSYCKFKDICFRQKTDFRNYTLDCEEKSDES